MRALRLLLPLLGVAIAAPASSQITLFADDFENGLSNWTVEQASSCGFYVCDPTVTWQVLDAGNPCASWAAPFPSGNRAAWYGHPAQCTFAGAPDSAPHAALVSAQPIALPSGSGTLVLRFFTKSEGEDNGWDVRGVQLVYAGQPYPDELARLSSSNWYEQSFDLTPYAGMSVKLRFDFNTGDPVDNAFHGWYLDDVRIEALAGTGIGFCSGDGTAIDCPCSNFGATGHGCSSSFDPAGAQLSASGAPDVSADSLVLNATGVASSLVILFQGTQQADGGRGIVVGDGLRCAAGSLVRLKAVLASGGAAQFPGPGDPPLSVAGQVPATGGFRTYQVWHRDAANFCTTSTFNLSNGLMLTWTP